MADNMTKDLPKLVVTRNGIPFKDQAEGIRQFKEACCAPTRLVARPIEEYHEDMGDVLWWVFDANGNPTEGPYCGGPNDLGYAVEMHTAADHERDLGCAARIYVGGWPGYHTHFTTFEVPVKPPSMTLGELVIKIVGSAAEAMCNGHLDGYPHFRAFERWITRGGIKL